MMSLPAMSVWGEVLQEQKGWDRGKLVGSPRGENGMAVSGLSCLFALGGIFHLLCVNQK